MFGACPASWPPAPASRSWRRPRRRRSCADRLGLAQPRRAGAGTRRQLTKADMPENDARPDVRVDPDTFAVTIDGELVEAAPAAESCRWPSATSCSDADDGRSSSSPTGGSRPGARALGRRGVRGRRRPDHRRGRSGGVPARPPAHGGAHRRRRWRRAVVLRRARSSCWRSTPRPRPGCRCRRCGRLAPARAPAGPGGTAVLAGGRARDRRRRAARGPHQPVALGAVAIAAGLTADDVAGPRRAPRA